MKLARSPLLLIGFGLLLAASVSGDETPLNRLLRHPALRGARVGLVVEQLDSGERLAEQNPDGLLVPASNQKLLTAAAALAHWGPSHRFETPILMEGSLEPDGVLTGRLWLVGRGDPSLVSEQLWKLAEQLRLRGLTAVTGGIGVDVSYFDAQRFHPDWEPVTSRAYYAPTSALATNYSSFRIEVTPGSEPGAPVRTRLAPAIPYFRIGGDAVTVAAAGTLRVAVEKLPDGSGEQVIVRGALAVGKKATSLWRSVALPELYAAELLRAQLRTQGVSVKGRIRVASAPASAVELLRFRGESIAEIVRKLNKYSNNFIAEQLTKALGAERYGAPGSWESGTRATRELLLETGVSVGSAVIADGSGLSPKNRISAASLVRVIRSAALRPESGPEFLASLPLGGLDGTLEDRMKAVPMPVRGKTGHLRHVSSLSGIVSTAQGELRVFSILVNGARGGADEINQAIDEFVASLSDSS